MLSKMRKAMRHTAALAMLAALVGGTWSGTAAADYPDRPISLMIPYNAGGATDFQARIVTMVAEEFLGQPIAIINRPGAGGQTGWDWFIRTPDPDGYTLASYNVPHFIAQSIVGDTMYSIDNLEPIANWGADPAVLIANEDAPFDTVEEFVEYAEENPGGITLSGAGRFVGHHIALLQLEEAADIELTYVPNTGGAPAMTDVVGGATMAGFNNLSDAFRNKDRIKILAVADLERDEKFLPDVPTFKEKGIDVDDSSNNFRGIMVKEGTPQEVIDRLAEEFPKMFEDEGVQERMEAGGSPMRIMTRDELKEMWQERQEYLSELLEGLAD